MSCISLLGQDYLDRAAPSYIGRLDYSSDAHDSLWGQTPAHWPAQAAFCISI